jgi:hypothetical protein
VTGNGYGHRGWHDGDDDEPVEIGIREALGVFHDSPDEPRRVRLLDAGGEERARLVGVLDWDEGDSSAFSRGDAGDARDAAGRVGR